MKAYKKQEVFEFRILNSATSELIEAEKGEVLLTDKSGRVTFISKTEFREGYEYVFKEGVTGDCRLKREIVDVTKTSVGRTGYLVSHPMGGISVVDDDIFEDTYELTHSDEDIVSAFRQVDAGMAHNVHLSHSNVVMISRDHYAALCDLAYGLPKQLS